MGLEPWTRPVRGTKGKTERVPEVSRRSLVPSGPRCRLFRCLFRHGIDSLFRGLRYRRRDCGCVGGFDADGSSERTGGATGGLSTDNRCERRVVRAYPLFSPPWALSTNGRLRQGRHKPQDRPTPRPLPTTQRCMISKAVKCSNATLMPPITPHMGYQLVVGTGKLVQSWGHWLIFPLRGKAILGNPLRAPAPRPPEHGSTGRP